MDQCKHCTCRGDMKTCRATECSQHESWYAKELEQQDDWISLETRLPEVEVRVLASTKNSGIVSVRLSRNKKHWFDHHETSWFLLDAITHWQPLPDKPEEGGI